MEVCVSLKIDCKYRALVLASALQFIFLFEVHEHVLFILENKRFACTFYLPDFRSNMQKGE